MAESAGGNQREASREFGAIALVLGAACSWGTWSLFLRPSGLPASATGPLVFAGLAVFGAAMLPFERVKPVVDREVVVLVVASGVLDAINVLTFFGAMATTTVAIAVLTHYLAPILVALAAPRIERERVPGARVAASVALVGLLLVLAPWRAEGRSAAPLTGAVLGSVSALAYAGNVLVSRRLVPRIGAIRTIVWHAVISGLLLAPFAPWGAVRDATWTSLGLVALGALLPGTLAGVLFMRGLAVVGSSRASVLAFAEPLVAVLVGVVVWRESLHATAAVGLLLVLGAGIRVASARAIALDGPVTTPRSRH